MINIFQSAVNRLTLWYVAVLFVVCFILSTPTYFIALNRIENNARRQTQIITDIPAFGNGDINQQIENLRDVQIRRDRRQLLQSLALINLGILGIGAYLSYLFAKRTLQPIEEAHRAQARFTTDASHELRTPLAVMQAEIDVALRDKKLTLTGAKDVLVSNLEEIARLRRLSEQLLNLTRLDNKTLVKKAVSLSKVLQEEVGTLKKQHPDAAITPTVTKSITTQGDESLLRESIKILLENAIKYGGKKPKLEVSLHKKDSQALLAVTDHGIGIKASELEHIFERFYRGSNATKVNGDGHGLGLAIAKQIADVHGGSLKAASHDGRGSTFTLTLPA
jgi:signal transduction histidine kinase